MCEHKSFSAIVDVGRVIYDDCRVSFVADVKIKCDGCNIPFEFIGLEKGVSFLEPKMSFDNKEARLPIQPSSDPVDQVNVMLNL